MDISKCTCNAVGPKKVNFIKNASAMDLTYSISNVRDEKLNVPKEITKFIHPTKSITINIWFYLFGLCVVVVRPLNMSTGVPYCKRRTHEIS